ncbi:MAG: sulfatase-like hydrolase/transferase [Actinomycetota bacterium]
MFALAVGLAGCSTPGDSTLDGQRQDDGKERPNIMLVIADDFGVDASPCSDLGAEKPSMPTLERLCGNGIVFDNAWSNPTCTPTRATLHTGRYGVRTGVGAVDTPLSGGQPSIHKALAGQGYATAVFGKWHLGGGPEEVEPNSPSQAGVPYYAGFLSGGMTSYTDWPLTVNGRTTDQSGYATTVFTDLARDWIVDQDQPWFTWLAYTAPHAPLHLPPKTLHDRDDLSGTSEDIAARPRDYYFAAAESMDRELGRLLDGLPTGERENTLVLFVADNGTSRQVIQEYNPDQAKGSVYQGGIHVPLVVAGAGVTRAGEREDALVNTTDLFATIVAAAGGNPATAGGTDGVDLNPVLVDAAAKTRDYAYAEQFGAGAQPREKGPRDGRRASRQGTASGEDDERNRPGSEDMWAIRDDRYKLVVGENGREELYDLQRDPLETQNLLRANNSLPPDLRERFDALRVEAQRIRTPG